MLMQRWLRRYKPYFACAIVILCIQLYLAYRSFGIIGANEDMTAAIVESSKNAPPPSKQQKKTNKAPSASRPTITHAELGFEPPCEIASADAISALQRAQTTSCRHYIANVTCAIQQQRLYPTHLVSSCPAQRVTSSNVSLGCFRDEKDKRLLSEYVYNFKDGNTPAHCVDACTGLGFPYAGVQYSSECFCGNEAPKRDAQVADSDCNMMCTGDAAQQCGGYFRMNIYQTGIAKFQPQLAATSASINEPRVRIAFLLTLNGRALRQVHRLIRTLYNTRHIFYIHVDERQDYLYRNLLKAEAKYKNIFLARKRFSTIWGGASLLSMLLTSMEALAAPEHQWDFVINLSESDYPIKPLNKLVEFLSSNKGKNFVKSHGRGAQRFVQKQGLDQTFVECETRMWRIGGRQLPTGIQIDGGSDWIALSRPFVEFIVRERSRNELLQGLDVIFRHTLLPAESYFHVVLRNTHFCNTYINNNLHFTNWKRKLGCKCQYKHVVDWCGCSPNDLKSGDLTRLQDTKPKQLFFARKFESIINQEILQQLESWLFGTPAQQFVNLHSYWQSLYHAEDAKLDDVAHTLGESLVRLCAKKFELRVGDLHELTHFLHKDEYKGIVVRYTLLSGNSTWMLESRVRPLKFINAPRNARFSKRWLRFEVSSDYDQKEQIARNYAKFLGPYTQPVLSYALLPDIKRNSAGHSYNLTALWIDPLGRLQDYTRLHIEESREDVNNYSKPKLLAPLTPGNWTVKLISAWTTHMQLQFLVTPLAYYRQQAVDSKQAETVNGGVYDSLDFLPPPNWREHIKTDQQTEQLKAYMLSHGQRTGAELEAWIDQFTAKFYSIRESCIVDNERSRKLLPLCRETSWSSLAPDPKSDIDALPDGSHI